MQIVVEWNNGQLSYKTDCQDYMVLFGMLEGARELISINQGAIGKEIKKGKSDIMLVPGSALPKLTRD